MRDYTNCLLNVRCSSPDSQSSSRTCQYATKNNTCTVFLQNSCQFPEESKKLPCNILKANISENKCQKDMSTYCLQNFEEKICLRYNNRCTINQQSCLGKLENWFDEIRNNRIFYSAMEIHDPRVNPDHPNLQTPLKTCLANPFEFFRFERKMAVLELDTNSFKYVKGLPFNASVSSSHSISSGLRWSGQASTSFSLGPSISFDYRRSKGRNDGKIQPGTRRQRTSALDLSTKLMGLEGKMGMTSSTSNDAGKDISVRVLEGAYLNVHQSVIQMDVKKFKKCLVIKPRPNAFLSFLQDDGLREKYMEGVVWDKSFHGDDIKKVIVSRPGLLICNPIEKREKGNLETIEEYYYYIAQELSRNMEFMFLYDARNRPFTILLRGQAEFFKYFSLMKDLRGGRDADGKLHDFADKATINFFADYSYPIEEVVGLNYAIREINETGFQSGIYTYPDRDWLNSEFFRKESPLEKGLFERLDRNNIFTPPQPSGKSFSNQIWGK